jgi:hypothetical protein
MVPICDMYDYVLRTYPSNLGIPLFSEILTACTALAISQSEPDNCGLVWRVP